MGLKYYDVEDEKYGAEFNIKIIGQKETIMIINKLIRHFKIPPIKKIEFTKRKDGGTYWRKSMRISFHPRNIRIGVICHELAHHWDYMKNRINKYNKKYFKTHTKKHARYTKRLMDYCKKKNYWDLIKTN